MLYTQEAIKKRIRKIRFLKKSISIIAYMLIIPLLIYNISLIVQTVVNPNKTPSFLGIKTYSIISGSMDPALKIGDIVIVKETLEKKLKKGQIISFRQGQSVVTHRIIDVREKDNKKIYITKGDNNNVEDNMEIDASLIEGRVIYRIPFLGRISQMLQGKIIIIVIAIMAYTYFAHSSKVSSRKNRRRVKRLKHEEEKE